MRISHSGSNSNAFKGRESEFWPHPLLILMRQELGRQAQSVPYTTFKHYKRPKTKLLQVILMNILDNFHYNLFHSIMWVQQP